MDPSFIAWLQSSLASLLGIPVTDDVLSYLLSFENKQELERYLFDLLGHDNSAEKFVREVLLNWKPQKDTAHGGKLYRKTETDDSVVQLGAQNSAGGQQNPRERGKKPDNGQQRGSQGGPTKMIVDVRGSSFTDKTQLMAEEIHTPKKKGGKFIPLYSADGVARTDVMQYPGRHACQCLGQKHGLINNCLECGRIVCSQEGSGPCLFCGTLVCTQLEMETLARNSKKSAKLYEKLMNPVAKEKADPNDENLQKAIEHKNRLLDYDRSSTRRTKVIDDQADYFASNSRWLSEKEKATLQKRENELRERRHKSRIDQTFTLDFAGRRVVEDAPDLSIYSGEDEVIKKIFEEGTTQEKNSLKKIFGTSHIADPRVKVQLPVYLEESKLKSVHEMTCKDDARGKKSGLRIQDKEFQEMRDEGSCLSMHQPWASLLVKGIKRVEGRSWYTAHRGRLWIASTVQKPDSMVIHSLQEEYKQYYPDEKLPFPNEYPTGALLGCVDVTDCITGEEYKERAVNKEENGSQYVFLCENPRELTVKFPVKGKHKIWKLDVEVHQAAKRGILRT